MLWSKDKQVILFSHFCYLVVEHYREHKEIQYDAEQMDYHPKYLSRVIHAVTNGLSPRQWITVRDAAGSTAHHSRQKAVPERRSHPIRFYGNLQFLPVFQACVGHDRQRVPCEACYLKAEERLFFSGICMKFTSLWPTSL